MIVHVTNGPRCLFVHFPCMKDMSWTFCYLVAIVVCPKWLETWLQRSLVFLSRNVRPSPGLCTSCVGRTLDLWRERGPGETENAPGACSQTSWQRCWRTLASGWSVQGWPKGRSSYPGSRTGTCYLASNLVQETPKTITLKTIRYLPVDWGAPCTASFEPLWLAAGESQQRPGSS